MQSFVVIFREWIGGHGHYDCRPLKTLPSNAITVRAEIPMILIVLNVWFLALLRIIKDHVTKDLSLQIFCVILNQVMESFQLWKMALP